MAGDALNVFISYSHRDEALKDELAIHLKILQREGKINTWQDRDIEAGAEWAAEIKANLESAQIILLLITRNFLASDYCYEKEMQRAVQRHYEGTARVVPIILKPCAWKYSDFKDLQVIPRDGRPVTRWEDPDEAFLDVENGLRRVVESLQKGQASPVVQPAIPVVQPAPPTGDFIETLNNGVRLEMVKIPSGSFWMGSPDNEEGRDDDEGPLHYVTVPEFWMGKYPVTQAQWSEVAALPKISTDLQPFPAHFKGKNRPVEQVNWFEAVEFCQRLSREKGKTYRLPSEAEWEYACRAMTTTPFYFGNTITTDQANYDGNYTYGSGSKGVYREQTTDVGSFPANKFGLYDMHGNVWEWCQGVWHESYTGAPIDGSAWATGGNQGRRLLRGGSWYHYPWYCRSAYRYYFSPVNRRLSHYGFRVVCGAARTSS